MIRYEYAYKIHSNCILLLPPSLQCPCLGKSMAEQTNWIE